MTIKPVVTIKASKANYASFGLVKKQIANIEAIDYFFAKQLLATIGTDLSPKLSTDQQADLFHLLLALSESLRQGHSCLVLTTLADQPLGFACDEQDNIIHSGYAFTGLEPLETLLGRLDISPGHQAPIVYHQQRLYLRRYFQFEYQLGCAIEHKINHGKNIDNLDSQAIAACLQQLFPDTNEHNIMASGQDAEIDWQKIAVANALNKYFSVIAGGPGTGKTYTVTKLLAALIMLDQQQRPGNSDSLRIALVAPTGKAAQRLSESIANAVNGFRGLIADQVLDVIPTQAQTIHRLLGVIGQDPNFRHHQDNLLAIDVLLIDEVSMVDLALMARVFRALPGPTKVVLLGDADQLPSVAAGNVLADLAPRPHLGFSEHNRQYLHQVCGGQLLPMETKAAQENNNPDHLTFLTKSRRFDDKGGIGLLAKAVIAGHEQPSWHLLKQQSSQQLSAQLNLLTGSLDNWLPALVNKYYLPLFDCHSLNQGFALLGKFRLLCATRQGEHGVEAINERVQTLLRPGVLLKGAGKLYHGLPIMISENDHNLGLYNGDIGLIWRNQAGLLIAAFEDAESGFKQFMPSRLPKFETVYAMTIHKTQGSEFTHVAMVLPKHAGHKLLSRELLYTGITRAKALLSIASSASVWSQGVREQVKRYSGLQVNKAKKHGSD